MQRWCKEQGSVMRKRDRLEIILQWIRANMARDVVRCVNICHCSSDPTARGKCLKQRILLEKFIKCISEELYMCVVLRTCPCPHVNGTTVQISCNSVVTQLHWSHISEVLMSLVFHCLPLWVKNDDKGSRIMGKKEREKGKQWPEIEYLTLISHLTLDS